MLEDKNKGEKQSFPSFRQMCWAASGYLVGCTSVAVYHTAKAGLPLEKIVILSGLSTCVGFMLPIAIGVVGHEIGRAGGTLIGSVGEIGYHMADAITPQSNKHEKIKKFRDDALRVGKMIGTGLGVAASCVGLHYFMTGALDDAAAHGPR